MEVQIFGTNKSQDTKKALRFFAERRIKVHFVDLKEKGASKGELQRFVQKFGLTALIDKESRRYQDLGLGVVRYSDERWLETLIAEPLVLRQPLTRWQQKVTVGLAEAEWKLWVEAGKA
jgi:arsenate reductase-like glutaredoxin family protein